ncbi:MAG: serine hydrolase [Myxococcota bacterium]|nr:serine hydrolase [Myxococcota bacterium]
MSDVLDLAAFVGEQKVCTALAWGWVDKGRVTSGSIGCDEHAIFDLASLTKPLATVTTVAFLLDDGALSLDQKIGFWLPEAGTQFANISIADLLHHRAGLLAFSESLATGLQGAPETKLRALRHRALEMPLRHRPGTVVYSDLGFILLAWICQRAGRPVDALRRHPGLGGFVVPPLDEGLEPLGFVATGRDENGLPLLGRVHDPTCRLVGGINCGHAGWFGDLGSTLRASRAWLDLACGRASALPAAARQLIEHAPGQRSAGFDIPTPGGTTGSNWGPRSFGHLGFTGTAMWVDPDADRCAVLLTNRTWPDGDDRGIGDLRRYFFSAVL